MKKLLIIFLLIPSLTVAQDAKKQKEKKPKVDANSGATWVNKGKKETLFKGLITGKVKDTETNESLEFATVSLTEKRTNKLIEGTITDMKGRFSFEDIEIGEYLITISFIGFEEKNLEIETTNKKPDSRLKNIFLTQNAELLSEVKIEEKKSIYESRIDKIVYNAENDLNDSENDATDVLRKAPLLSVDLEGNVSLRGSNNIKFLVNGKASSFFSSDISTALQMIPAGEIKSVEVITSPGARYDGEGDAGIVNIITKRTIIDGYQATLSGMGGSKAVRGNFNLKIGKGKFGISARAGTFGSLPGRIGSHYYERKDWDSLVNGEPYKPNILIQEGISESFYQGYRGSISSFYNPNAYNSFNSSISLRGRTKPSLIEDSIKYTHGTYEDSIFYNSYYSSEKTDRTINIECSTDYTKKFEENEAKELTIAFQFGGDINDANTDIKEGDEDFFNVNDERVLEQTIQIDYTHPFGKSLKNKIPSNTNQSRGFSKGGSKGIGKNKKSNSNIIEIGAKAINRERQIIYSDKINNILLRNEEFNYNQIVAASYLSSEFNLKYGIGLKAGIRHEFTQANGDWKNEPERKFTTPYQDILPSFVISKSFSPMRAIKLSYNQRITRPSVRQINTNTNKLDNRNITIGNPYLKPTVTEQVELGINSFGRILQGSLQIYYKNSTNIIESFLDSISDETSWSSYRNIGESKQFGTNIFGSINLKKFNLRVSFDVYNYSGKDATLGYNEWTEPVLLYSYWIGGNYDIGKNWKIETSTFYRSPNRTIQGSSTTWSMMSIGIKKTFNNKRGSIGIRIIEPFNKNKEFVNELDGEFFSQSNNNIIPFRSFGISLKYTLGKLNFKDSNKRSNIENNDIQEESGGEF